MILILLNELILILFMVNWGIKIEISLIKLYMMVRVIF